tara:strand:- start:1405 stop:3699 length:2295 start_codon:yes stop_codon:yes gene_type:complete
MRRKITSFPSMVVSEKEKNKEWCNNVLDSIIGYMSHNDSTYTTSRTNDIGNYAIYNGDINQDDYAYITEQYGLTYPARLVNYPIITPKIDLLVGEELKRPIDMKVSTINKEAVIRKLDHKVAIQMKSLLQDIHSEFEEVYGAPITDEGQGMPVPDDISIYMKYNYREMVEENAQDGLEYVLNRYNLKDKFKEGFRDLLVTGKEFFKVDIVNGDPHARRVDPRSVIYDNSVHSDYLDDASWVGEERWLSVNEINDEFKEWLTKEDLEELDGMRNAFGSGTEGYNSNFQWLDAGYGKENRIRVISVEWKSLRAIKFKLSPNKYDPDRPFRKMVKDTYRKRKGETIETKWVDDIWEATKIGGKILVKAKRRDNQVRSVDDPGKTALSYIGCIKGNTTGKSTSIVDLLHNVQMLYNIVVYQIELAMARSGGKAVVYDTSQIPTNVGMDMQTVLYHLKTDGIIPINSKDEGGQIQSFNQFQQVDFTLSQSVQQLINLKLMLEDMAGQLSGVTRQREGAVEQYEYVGNVQRSVVQSSTITESWFYSHAEVKQRVLESLCNNMKIAWADGKKAAMILGDGAYKFLNIMPSIALQDYGVYVGDSGKDDAMKQVVQQLAQSALQAGNIDLLNILKVIKADTMTEAEKVLEKGMEKMKEQAAEQQQREMQQIQAQQEAEQSKFEAEAQLKQMDNDTKIQVAEIQAESRMAVAKLQSEDKRDIHDSSQDAEFSKKLADHELSKDTDNKEGERNVYSGESEATAEDKMRAKEKVKK